MVLFICFIDCSRAGSVSTWRATCQRMHHDNYSGASRALCDILAINVGIVRKACKSGRADAPLVVLSMALACHGRQNPPSDRVPHNLMRRAALHGEHYPSIP